MTNSKMPITSATITVTGEGAAGSPVQIYDADGIIPGTDYALIVPPKGSFVLDIDTVDVYPFDTQTIGGGSYEFITLEDVTNKDTVPKIRVKGTIPEGFEGPAAFTVNGVFDSATYTFPDGEHPFTVTVESDEPEPEGMHIVPSGSGGLGFFTMRRLIMRADMCEYTAGGIPIPDGINVEALACVSAKGGYLGWFDRESRRVLLYTAPGKEATGTIEDVTLIFLGTMKV